MGTELLDALDARLTEAERAIEEEQIRALVVSAPPGSVFVAGADEEEVRSFRTAEEASARARRGQATLRRLELLRVPTIAAVEGACLGAGAELALAASYRLASDAPGTRFAFPEVASGLIPALGGTVRLPRLVGLRAALELIVDGRVLDPREARRIGLVDEVFPAAEFPERVMEFARERVRKGRIRTGARRSLRHRLVEDTAPGRRVVFLAARRAISRADRSPGSLRALDVVADGVALPLEAAFAGEADAFGELAASPESRGLLHAAALRSRRESDPGGREAAEPERIAVVGGGPEGGVLALLLARAGATVRLRARTRPELEAALGRAREAVPGPKGEGHDADALLRRISASRGYGGFGAVDTVLASGSHADQAAALREAEEHVSDGCVLAWTSPRSPGDGSDVFADAARVAGLRFFPSVREPRAAEVVRTPESAPRTVQHLCALAQRVGATPFVVEDRPGSLLPRLLLAWVGEAIRLAAEGAAVEEVDRALAEFGAMPPLLLADAVGVEGCLSFLESLSIRDAERMEALPLAQLLRRAQLEGGASFYRYRPGRAPTPGTRTPRRSRGRSDALPTPSADEIRERVLLATVNEGARLLEDGVARPGEVDLASLVVLGFPSVRGGVLFDADSRGLAGLQAASEGLAMNHGGRFTPAPLLTDLAARGGRFYDLGRPSGQRGPGVLG